MRPLRPTSTPQVRLDALARRCHLFFAVAAASFSSAARLRWFMLSNAVNQSYQGFTVANFFTIIR
jgi:hypothetical protein